MTAVVGLDLSLAGTGIATGLRCRTISVRSKGPARLVAIRRAIAVELMSTDGSAGFERATEYDLAVLEGYALGVQGAGIRSNAELGGVVRAMLFELGIGIVDVPPRSLKLFATGHGGADKTAMILAAIRDAGGLYTIADDNQADAYWLRQLGLAIVGKRVSTPEQRRALEKVEVSTGIRRMALSS